jgi:hypothetical protein
VAVLSAGLLAHAQQAPRLTFQEVLSVGEPAQGFAPGSVIWLIGDAPRIDADGNVSINVNVRDTAGKILQGLYRNVAGATQLVFKAGDPAPGTGVHFLSFPDLPQSPRISGGRLTFSGNIEDAAAGSLGGLWSERTGSFQLLALTGDVLPGMPPDGDLFSLEPTTRGDVVLLRAKWSRPFETLPEDKGLWRDTGGGWEPLVVHGMPAPGLSGAVFGADPTRVFGPLFAFNARADGRVLVQAWVRGSKINANNDEALWIESGAGLQILVREGARADSREKMTFGPTSSSPTFGADIENLVPTLNDQGAVLFGAVLRSGKTRLNSLWTNRSGQLALLARGSVPVSGFGQGDQAPGFAPGVTYATFFLGRINNRNQIAFQGTVDEFENPSRLTPAIWWDVPGALSLVAAQGRPVPGAPGAVYATVSFESLSDAGEIFFSAKLGGSGVTAANDGVLMRADPNGTLGIVLREGDTVEVVDTSGARAMKVVSSFRFSRELANDGRAAAHLDFADGSSGVYTTDGLMAPLQ